MTKPNLAVLGGGNGAHAMAADAALRGFPVTMYEMPRYESNIQPQLETQTIRIEGEITGNASLKDVTTDIDEALADADIVALVVPAFAHKEYAELLAGRLQSDQLLLVFPGAFGSLEIRRIFEENSASEAVCIAETNNLPYDTRLLEPGRVKVFGMNPINLGVLPADRTEEVLSKIGDLFEFEKVYNDVIECGLSLVNPALHSGACVINIGQIEYWAGDDFYLYEQGFTPSAAKLDVRLDDERKAIGDALGYSITSFEDFAELEENWDWKDLYRETHGHIGLTPIEGPDDIENRYLTEDAPYGLVTWSSIADELGVETPLIDAIIDIYSTVHERDWRTDGRTATDLGLDGLSATEMQRSVQVGTPEARVNGGDPQ